MKYNELRKTFPLFLIVIYLLFTTGIILTGSLYYHAQKKSVLDEHADELIAISSLKTGQIVSWLNERYGDAIVIRENAEFIKAVARYFNDGQESGVRKWLESVKNSYEYGNILLLDKNHRVALTLDKSDTIPGEMVEKNLQDLEAGRKIVFNDLHRSSVYNRIHYDITIPLLLENSFIGTIILRIDPSNLLFPLIQSWPTYSRSSETLIVRPEIDRVLFINELRHKKNTSMSFWLPLTDTTILAVKASLGRTGLMEGVDYLKNPVLGYSNRIPGTDWILITKTDKKEIYEPVEQYLILTIIITFSLILINSSIFAFWIWNQHIKTYRAHMVYSEKLAASEKLYRSLFENMLNGFAYCRMIFDSKERPIDFEYIITNKSFSTLTGLSDVDGKKVSEIIPGLLESDRDLINTFSRISRGGAPEVFESYVEALSLWFSISVYSPENGYFVSIFDVITDRKLAEAKLKESEMLYKGIGESIDYGVWVCEPDGRNIYASDSFLKLVGITQEQCSEFGWGDVLHPDDAERTIHTWQECVKSGNYWNMEHRFRGTDGEWHPVLARGVPIRDENGRISRWAGINLDISDLKKAELNLRKSEERFRSVLDNMLEGCQIIGHDWKYLYINSAADIHNRRPGKELIGKNFLEKWPRIEETEVFKVLKRCMEDRSSIRMETRFVFPDASVGWFELSIQPVPEGIFILSIDITEKKLAENAVRESEELLTIQKRIGDIFLTVSNDEMYIEILRLILEKLSSPLGVFGYIDREGSFVVPTMTRHVWESCKMTDKKIIFPKDSWGNSSWPRAIREKRVDYSNSGSNVTPEGHMKLTRFISFPIIFHGDVIGLFQVSNKETDYTREDIQLLEKISSYLAPILNARLLNEWTKTEIVRLNNDLEIRVAERTRQLEEANMELESFSYSVSHDLRAPLRSVSGFTKILVDEYGDKLDEEAKRLCGIITSSTAKMGELIDDLLNFSRLGRSPLTPGRLNMNELVASVYNDITNDTEKNRIRIEIKNLPETDADASLMKIVWNNLLSNAVKYSSKCLEPKIIVDSERSDGMITYTVEDNGAGFDMRYYNKLFGVFQRLHSEEEFEGNGVGLAIVHRIIKRHNGKVWAEGKPGKGAKFFLSLPF